MSKPKIVFFGSGPVADESLLFLFEACDVEAVITKPQPAHHKHNMPTIELCKSHKVPYFTAGNKADLDEIFIRQSFTSKVGVVIDFGVIISSKVIDRFKFGIVNSHFSILPEWRGADPITFAILSGQEITGVSLMLINERMDEGKILVTDSLHIVDNETSETLTTKLVQLSNLLLSKHLPTYLSGSIKPVDQAGKPSYSRKLTKADGLIDWSKEASQIEREIRAFHSWPKSYTKLGSHDIIVRAADVVEEQGEPGAMHANKRSLTVHCGKDSLSITRIQPPGKKEMPIAAFLSGYKFS